MRAHSSKLASAPKLSPFHTPRSQRLRRVAFARPGEDLRQQFVDQLDFVFRVEAGTSHGAAVEVVGFVPHVPTGDAVVARKAFDDARNVLVQARIFGGRLQRGGAGTLHPARIVVKGRGAICAPK